MNMKAVNEKLGIAQDTLRYYERAGMIPPVTRTASGIHEGFKVCRACPLYAERRASGRNNDFLCCACTGGGKATILERLQLLTEQREDLLRQRMQMDATLERLNYKV